MCVNVREREREREREVVTEQAERTLISSGRVLILEHCLGIQFAQGLLKFLTLKKEGQELMTTEIYLIDRLSNV